MERDSPTLLRLFWYFHFNSEQTHNLNRFTKHSEVHALFLMNDIQKIH